MIKALIFDLDNCLAAADEVGRELYQPAFDAIRRANNGSVPNEHLERAFEDVWRHPLDWVATQYRFSSAMLTAGWRVFAGMEVTRPMRGYSELPILAELSGQRFLVTSGFRRLQESKVKALGLGSVFTAAYVDAIDEADRIGKEGLFKQIMKDYALSPAEVLIIGDNVDSELAAGRRLGMKTVQILRAGVARASSATFHVRSLEEVKELCALRLINMA